MFSYSTCKQERDISHSGFTLVEMLIAMAVTLLMMAAIGRGFAFVGERVKDSRANLQLSADLRDVTTRLRSELERCTVDLTPNTGGPDQAGYFTYYEGPVTDATSSLFAVSGTVAEPVLEHSRYGDFDDYIAFTAVAPPGSWFTGKVPRYLLDQRSNESGYSLPASPDFSGFDPVVIRSKYAEIIYFASPEYVTTSLQADAMNPANPSYIDSDSNRLPDRIRIHRRVLLIRPDLNLASGVNAGRLPQQTKVSVASPPSQSTIFMQADAPWPNASAGTVAQNGGFTEGWLYGMAAVHQQCDLSVHRVLGADGRPIAGGHVAANSLADLALPHNRFAHIRVPETVLTGGGGGRSSMPILALGGPALILDNQTTANVDLAPPKTPNSGPVVTPHRLSGFLRPEFVLGTDLIHHDPELDAWGQGRLGEDVLVNNALSFDVKIFDSRATSFTTTPANGNLVIGPNDAGYREELISNSVTAAAVTASAARGEIVGAYVDLCYPVLAGGSLRGWQGRQLDRLDTTAMPSTVGTFGSYLISDFSGVASYTTGNSSTNAYNNSLYRSGRVLTTGTTIRLFQPAFDTFTSFYERDGFEQSRANATNEGTWWTINTTASAVDHGSDGLDGPGIYGGGLAATTGSTGSEHQFGADDLGEHETQPPFLTPASSIQISIRLENPSNRSIRQSSVIHRGKR